MEPPPSSFAPTLLLAMPQLRDPNFVRSVVLLCEHGAQGALGFVVNRPTEVRAVDAVVLDPPASGDSGLMLWAGGPVESQRGFLLLGDDPGVADSERVAEGFDRSANLPQVIDALAAAALIPAARPPRNEKAGAALPPTWHGGARGSSSATPAGARASSTPS